MVISSTFGRTFRPPMSPSAQWCSKKPSGWWTCACKSTWIYFWTSITPVSLWGRGMPGMPRQFPVNCDPGAWTPTPHHDGPTSVFSCVPALQVEKGFAHHPWPTALFRNRHKNDASSLEEVQRDRQHLKSCPRTAYWWIRRICPPSTSTRAQKHGGGKRMLVWPPGRTTPRSAIMRRVMARHEPPRPPMELPDPRQLQ